MNLRTAHRVASGACACSRGFCAHANLADVWLQVRQARVDLLLLGFARRRHPDVLRPGDPVAATCWRRSGRRGFDRVSDDGHRLRRARVASRRASATCCGRTCWRGRKGCRSGDVRHRRHGARARSDGRARAAGDLRLGLCRRQRRCPARLLRPIEVSATIAAAVAGSAAGGHVDPGHSSRADRRLACGGGARAAAATRPAASDTSRARSAAGSLLRGIARRLFLARALVVSALARSLPREAWAVTSRSASTMPFPARSCCRRCSSLASRCRRPAASAAFTRPIASA